jgi:hypothetical protein
MPKNDVKVPDDQYLPHAGDSGEETGLASLLKNKTLLVGGGIVAGVAVVIAALTFGVFIPQGVQSEGNQLEAELSANYQDGANVLSNCVVKTKQSVGAAKANSEAFDKVIKDAIAGNGAAQHVDFNNPASRNGLFPVWVQAYPDFKGQTALFEKAMTVINGCQDDFRNKQSAVQDGVRQFNSWRTGSWKVRTFGGDNFPNENLYVTLPGLNLTGKAAFKKISAPIVDADTSGAYQSGEQQSNDPFAQPTS